MLMMSKQVYRKHNYYRLKVLLAAQIQEMTLKLQTVETNTQATLATLTYKAPVIDESHDEEEEEEKVPGGIKNAIDEISAKAFQTMAQQAI